MVDQSQKPVGALVANCDGGFSLADHKWLCAFCDRRSRRSRSHSSNSQSLRLCEVELRIQCLVLGKAFEDWYYYLLFPATLLLLAAAFVSL
jgi:hypothetical protein